MRKLVSRRVCGIRIVRTLVRRICICPRYPVDAPALRVCEATEKRSAERSTIRWLKAPNGDCVYTCGGLDHIRLYPFPRERSEQICLCPPPGALSVSHSRNKASPKN